MTSTQQQIEELVRRGNRGAFYTYYLSLGYDYKTAACLTLYTYGEYRFRSFSMEELYKALIEEKEYVPPEILAFRNQQTADQGIYGLPIKASSFPDSFAPPRASAPASPQASHFRAPEPMKGKPRGMMSRLMSSIKDMASGRSSAPAHSVNEPSEYELLSVAPSRAAMPASSADSAAVWDDAVSDDSFGFGSFEPVPAAAPVFATDEYERIEEKDACRTAAEPTSTFRMTTNTASAGIVLNQLRNGRRIDCSMVRIEEMLNYFRYESEMPAEDMFHLSCEIMDADPGRKYLYINVQGREEVKEHQHIIILLDVSGSMRSNARQTQAIIATVISKLGNGDKLSLVTYSDDDHVELEAFTVNGAEDRIHALEKLLSIRITGWTHGSKGIEKAYQIGKQHYIPGGNNQVILITDGDLNFGITDKGGLEELIEKKKKDNLFLSVIGTGLSNYKDDKLEVLSKHGNGVYRVVNSLTDVRKSIEKEYASLVNIIAKDVKAQVEFNPEVVESYRLLGFENRTLAREDFTNDKVISEPFGSGGYGVALYELTMKTEAAPVDSGLKYSRLVTTGSPETGTVKVRYKEPLEDKSHEVEKVIETADESFTDNLRLAFVVYVCAEKLRGSDKISSQEIDLAKKLYAELGPSLQKKNAEDLYKLAGILAKSEAELGIGLPEEPFPW